jgi:hypothetical protein
VASLAHQLRSARARVLLDQAGRHVATKLPISDTITLMPRPPKYLAFQARQLAPRPAEGQTASSNLMSRPRAQRPRAQLLYLGKLIDTPWKITSIGLGISVTINEARYQLMVAELVEERDGPSGFLKVKV